MLEWQQVNQKELNQIHIQDLNEFKDINRLINEIMVFLIGTTDINYS